MRPPSEAPPTPQPAEKSWTISEADFGDGASLLSATSNRSEYAWERVTGGDGVRVSIGGRELPFTNTRTNPVFASDLYGAEWEVAFEVRAGAVALVLTAQDQSGAGDTVESVRITNPGNGYASVPSVTFSPPPPGGTTAAGSVTGSGYVDSVTVGSAGSGYTSVPSVTFGAAPSGGTTAAGTAVLRYRVASVEVTNGGSGYAAAPTVTFSAPAGGTRATGTAQLAASGGYDQYQNLYWARQTLAGKQLLVRLAD